jgi:4-coumarate--CoA ligase
VTIFASTFSDVEIPDVPIHEYAFANADRFADRIALLDGPSGRSYTYAALKGAVASFAGGLAAKGFGKGDVLAIIAPNIPEYAIVFHGVSMAGGTITTVNPTYGPEEIAFQLKDAGAKIAVTIELFREAVEKAAAETGGVEDIVILGEGQGGTSFFEYLGEPLAESPAIDPANDVAVLPYSSGTTGLPKGVMLTHRNLVANICQMLPPMGFEEGKEVSLAVLPFFHIYGMQVLMNASLRIAGTLVTMPRFDLEQFLELIQEHEVTRGYVVPPIVLALAKHPIVDNYDLSSLELIFSGAAPLSASLAAEAGERIGCDVVQGYGMTEASPVTNLTPPGRFKSGTSGLNVPNQELRIVDPASGDDLDVGEEGELWFRGPQVMKGYLNNEEATRATLTEDGWLKTGDIGRIDEDGHVTITDRLKELIKVKGFQVPPAELEGILLTHADVADAAVIGIPDEESGELPKAYVVAKPDASPTVEDIKAHVAEHVATYKQLAEVEFIEAIPKSASGKILRRELRDS